VVRARRRETHYLDWRWNAKLIKDKEHINECKERRRRGGS